MLREVQSDCMQSARRHARENGEDEALTEPPFLRDWPALTMKLMILHAAHLGVSALAWTRGLHQVARYKGLGSEGLKQLYDRTLPQEVNRMFKPFGLECEMVEIYVPTNFCIRPVDGTYHVSDKDGRELGIYDSFEAAQAMIPDGAHELLYEMHGVRLGKADCAAILEKGFAAWG